MNANKAMRKNSVWMCDITLCNNDEMQQFADNGMLIKNTRNKRCNISACCKSEMLQYWINNIINILINV